MTWSEFQLRCIAYERMQEREDLRAREIAWASLTGFHIDPKKLPKSKDKFWYIGKRKNIISDNVKNAIKKAQKEYLETKKRK